MLACDTISLTCPKSGLLTQHYQEIAQQSPDPFPRQRAESEHETMCKHICVSNLEMAITATATPSEHLWATLTICGPLWTFAGCSWFPYLPSGWHCHHEEVQGSILRKPQVSENTIQRYCSSVKL